jgi:serine/threonine-protein phosphatase 2B catalytic subunit
MISQSQAATPAEDGEGALPAGPLSARLEELAQGGSSAASSASPMTPGSPATPTSPALGPGGGRGHRRQASLGTTKTSPSTRRRSLEGTMALIKDVVGGDGDDAAERQLQQLADGIVGA